MGKRPASVVVCMMYVCLYVCMSGCEASVKSNILRTAVATDLIFGVQMLNVNTPGRFFSPHGQSPGGLMDWAPSVRSSVHADI